MHTYCERLSNQFCQTHKMCIHDCLARAENEKKKTITNCMANANEIKMKKNVIHLELKILYFTRQYIYERYTRNIICVEISTFYKRNEKSKSHSIKFAHFGGCVHIAHLTYINVQRTYSTVQRNCSLFKFMVLLSLAVFAFFFFTFVRLLRSAS